ncbi:MAG: DUF1553 domain-containing protein [Planctomycetaceae bacterium]
MTRLFVSSIAFSAMFTSACADDVSYLNDIKPILKSKCWSCHGAIKQEAGLRLDTAQFLKTGGDSGSTLDGNDPANSLLLQRITATDESERMPPQGEPVSPDQIARITQWLKSGAHGPINEKAQPNPKTHWAFQPVTASLPPNDGHPIDAFIDQRLKNVGLQRSEPAEPVTLIRRMFLALHGLPPTPEQIDHWSQRLSELSGQQDAVRHLIDELLASPRYGERWAQHWLDVVRYADTHGYEVNTPRPNAWPYRDYVIQAFNEDKPYDRFVVEQLAGDTVSADAATGFMVAAAALLPGQIGKDEESKRLARQDELDEIIIGTTATFLGLTVGCARCHDHKFDPIPQSDYYAMQAFFAGVDYGERPLSGPDRDRRLKEADAMQPRIAKLRDQLNRRQPLAFNGRTVVIDDEDAARVTLLKSKNGHGSNPEGPQRGYRDDVGDRQRMCNLSRGRYTWWDNNPGEDVFTWNPGIAGRFRVWISWGVHGSGVHTHDARYILDTDGDLKTTSDQQQIAIADQYRFSGEHQGETEKKPLWSGLFDTGVHDFDEKSCLILRGGETETGITADVIVLQENGAAGHPRLRAPVNAAKTVERFSPVTAKFVRFTSLATIDDNKHEPCIDEFEVFSVGDDPVNVALADHGTRPTSSGNYSESGQHQLPHINDGKYGNDFSWISNERGQGWVQLEFPRPELIDRIEWARDREGKFKDRLPVRYQIQTSVDGRTWTTVATSDDRVPPGTPHDDTAALLRSATPSQETGVDVRALADELKRLQDQQRKLREPQMVFAGTFRDPDPTFVLNRGDPEQPTDEVAPSVLTSIGHLKLDADTPDQQRRLALARWIASPQNPLTARVMVNRIWQGHFGVGLVETSSDFGLNGASPSHPELLDWLAQDFIDHDWSIKHLQRVILTSATWQQSHVRTSESNSEANAVDPLNVDSDNRLLWRYPSRRIEAEVIRDSMLQISGRLNLTMGGPGFDFFKSRGGLSGFPPVDEFPPDRLRRMIYAHKIRMEPVPIFGAFDCPDAGLPAPRRSQSTTAIQALNLFNSAFVIDQSAAFADRVRSDVGDDPTKQILRAFLLATGRLPSDIETAATLPTVREHGLPVLCRALYNSSEFLFLP